MSACAVHTVSLEEAVRLGRENEIYQYCATMDLVQPKPNLIVIRDEGFVGSKNPHVIYVNGEQCADLMPGEKLSLVLSLGPQIIGTKNKWDPFSIGRLIETEVVIRDKVSIVRDGVDANGGHHINVSAK
jgi:hypothetical protein